MHDEGIDQIRTRVLAPRSGDKVSIEKRLKAEIVLMRSHARIVEDRPGYLVCEGKYGTGVADMKEASLFNVANQKPSRWHPFKSHLYAVHGVLCWAVLGVTTD